MKFTIKLPVEIAGAYGIFRKGEITTGAYTLLGGGDGRAVHDAVVMSAVEMDALDSICILHGIALLDGSQDISVMSGELKPVEIEIITEAGELLEEACAASELNRSQLPLEEFAGLCLTLGFKARQKNLSSELIKLCDALDKNEDEKFHHGSIYQ
jgi:hypothetical protein